MLEISHTWLETVIDVSIKLLLLGALAAIALVVLRVRDTNVRHRVWTAVLVGMLAMPLLVLITPAAPLPAWMNVSWQPPSNAHATTETILSNEPPTSVSKDATRDQVAIAATAPRDAPTFADADRALIEDFDGFATNSELSQLPSAAIGAMESDGIIVVPPTAEEPLGASVDSPRPWLSTHWPLILASTCVAVSTALLLRILVGLWVTVRLVRQGRPVDPYHVTRADSRNVQLLEHPQVYVPLTVGFVRPVVLLPHEWRTWNGEKLQAVLAHELAHVRRRDWLVTMLAELNRAIYWFHPLAWLLKRRLAALAEQCCDDAVLEANTGRAEYARYLLEVAASLTVSGRRCRAPLSSVAMARVPGVEKRIDAILDAGRPLARQLGVIGVAILLGVGIPAIIFAAALRPADEQGVEAASTTESSARNSQDRTETAKEPKTDEPVVRSNNSLQHVHGRVIGPDGNPIAGVHVYAAWTIENGVYAYSHEIMAETSTRADGEFDMKVSTERPVKGQVRQGWQVVAHADEYGPAWIRDVHLLENHSPTLQLTRDQPIRIRVVDLEGQPLSGVSAKVRVLYTADEEQAAHQWLQEAMQKEKATDLNELRRYDDSGRFADQFPTTWNDGQLMHGAPAMCEDVVSAADGTLQLEGLGANRLALVELSGSSIVKSVLHVVARKMAPISAHPVGWWGVRTPTYYGCDFEFVAEPSQPIIGTIKDIETGQPLAGFTVQLGQYAGNLASQDGFISTQSDSAGEYRLLGLPQGGGHRIEVDPPLDQPFFPTEKTLQSTTGLDAATCDFELKRGTWMGGKLAERDTGATVAGAIVVYLPLRTNTHAEDYPNYDPQITGSAPSDRYHTAEDGSFRVLGIPGGGILYAIAWDEDRHDYITLDPDEVPAHLRGEHDHLSTYHPWTITGLHALCEVEIPESAEDIQQDLQVTRGLTRRMNIVDENGQPVRGARVYGRTFPFGPSQPSDESVIEIIGLRPNEKRIVAFLHSERKIGRSLLLSAGDETAAELVACATVRGRVVDEDVQPMKDVKIDVSVDHRIVGDNWGRRLIGAETDEDGRFEVFLPTGLRCYVSTYSPPLGPNFSAECDPQPGDVIDMGDVTHGIELKVEDTAKLTIARQAADGKPSGERTPTAALRAGGVPALQAPLVYEGQVVTPEGKPAAGAELHLVYWYSDAGLTVAHNPAAKTHADGHFRFEMSRDDFHRTGDSVPPWQWASLVAVAEGFGMAWAPSLAFEKTGAVVDEMREAGHPTAADPARLRELIDGPQGRLRLAADDLPIHGRVVDTEGQPLAGARVRVVEVYQGRDGTLDDWIAAAGEPRADFYSVRQTVPSHLYGPLAEKLFAPVETDEGGRFTIGGIGRERLMRLVIEAPHSEWADIYCRTRPGEPLAIGSGMADQAMGVYGPEFSHVAAPSKPVVGVVTDGQTGEPIAGVIVRSHESWMSTAPGKVTRGGSDFSRAATDERGRYELLGLPRSEYNPIEFVPKADAAYLPRTSQVDTKGTNVEPVTLDAKLERGLVVTGRVVDAETGGGVSGRLAYLAASDDPDVNALTALPTWSARLSDARSDIDGHFEVVVPGGRGYLAFTAFSDIYEKNAVRPEGAASPQPYYFAVGAGPEFHAIAKLDPADDADRLRVEMEVHRGRVVTGVIVDAQGDPLEDGQYIGRSESSRWRPIDGGRFVVNNYDPARPRRLAFVHREKRLAGTQILEGEIDDAIEVVLGPWGSLTGRVLDDQGDPIAGLLITAGSMQRMMRVMPSPAAVARADIDQVIPLPPAGDDPNARHLTDDDGRFTIEGLVPGETYELSGFEQASFEARINGDIATGVVVELGQTLDLGDVTLQQPDFEALQREAEKQAEEARKEQVRQKNAADASTNASRATRARAVAAEQNAEHSTIHVAGKVLAPNGQPLAGARLYWPRTKTPEPRRLDDMYLQQVATSEQDGSFTAELKYPTTSWVREVPLLAVADGFGMAWVDVSSSQTQDGLTLQLAEEFPISGRILTTEGSPVPGAAIGLYSVMADSSGSIDNLLTAWKSEWRSASMRVDKVLHIGLHLAGEILGNEPADEQGRFTIRGLGTEQAVWFTVTAPSIAKNTAIVITREGFEPAAYNDAALAQVANMALELRQLPKLFANELTIVAEAGKMITGKVTDIESGQPLEGVLVDTSAGYGDAIMATTDANGEYRLSGIPLFDDEILISFRKPHTRYLPRTLATRLSPGLAPMEFDAGLAKGVVLRGRVTETETGKPVAGGIRFAPLEDNAWRDKPGYDNYKRSRVMENVDQDGNFEFNSIPGPGVLLMQAGRSGIEIGGRYVKPYRKGRFSEEDREKVRIYVEGESFYTSSDGLEFFENGMKVVGIPEDVEEYSADLTVDRGMDVDVAIVDDQNEPLSGTMVCGVTESWPITYTIDEPRCTIYALDPERPRQVILYHPERKLAALLTLRGDEVQSPVARLVPTGTLVGRAVDADGQPLAAADVSLSWRDDTAREFQRQLDMTREVAATDDDGRFRLEGVFPGVYRLRFQQGEKRFRTDSLLEDATTVLAAAAGVGGREIQLGDVVVRPQ